MRIKEKNFFCPSQGFLGGGKKNSGWGHLPPPQDTQTTSLHWMPCLFSCYVIIEMHAFICMIQLLHLILIFDLYMRCNCTCLTQDRLIFFHGSLSASWNNVWFLNPTYINAICYWYIYGSPQLLFPLCRKALSSRMTNEWIPLTIIEFKLCSYHRLLEIKTWTFHTWDL